MQEQQSIQEMLQFIMQNMVTRAELELILEKKLEKKFNEKLKDYATRNEMITIVRGIIKEELKNHPTKDDFKQFKSEIYPLVDGLAARHKDYESEHAAFTHRADRLQTRVEVLETAK